MYETRVKSQFDYADYVTLCMGCAYPPPVRVIRMTKARRNVRPDRAAPHGMECLEGRALLSGVTHAAAAAAQQAAIVRPMMAVAHDDDRRNNDDDRRNNGDDRRTTEGRAVAPPMLDKSHLLRNGNTVTGLVMTFSKPLNPATAQDLKNYASVPPDPGRWGRHRERCGLQPRPGLGHFDPGSARDAQAHKQGGVVRGQ